eukprot:SAG31_NODE_3057_length_4736_cov_28.760190_4_plen_220_part_00
MRFLIGRHNRTAAPSSSISNLNAWLCRFLFMRAIFLPQEHAAAMHKRTRLENPPPPVQQSPSRAAEDVSKTPPRPHFDSVDCVSALAAGTNSPPTSSPTEPASNETPKAAAESETALWPCGMAMPLPPSVAWRMLSDSSQELPHRPNQFSAAAAEFIFKESGKRSYFLVFVQLFEKYGTLIERNTALIEKVSPCRAGRQVSAAHEAFQRGRPLCGQERA